MALAVPNHCKKLRALQPSKLQPCWKVVTESVGSSAQRGNKLPSRELYNTSHPNGKAKKIHRLKSTVLRVSDMWIGSQEGISCKGWDPITETKRKVFRFHETILSFGEPGSLGLRCGIHVRQETTYPPTTKVTEF